TEGRVKSEMHFSGALSPAKEQIVSLQTGLFDMGPVSVGYAPGKTPLLSITELPFISPSHVALGKAFFDYNEWTEVTSELQRWNVKFIGPGCVPNKDLMSSVPVRNLKDLKGLKIHATGPRVKSLEAVGATPVSIPGPEMFTAIERGTIDGVILPYYAMGSYSIYEAGKYITALETGAFALPWLINLDFWNKLPPDIQGIMMNLAVQVPDKYAEVYEKVDKEWVEKFRKAGVEFIELTPDELAMLKQTAQPVWDNWVKDKNDKGLPGTKALSIFLSSVRKYE
ncbi:TRAP transporter substrate-binding protein DctP, partial [Chloroflexota bacterium]